MPFYDLKCADCGVEFNASATITERTEKLIPCPKCRSTYLKAVYKGASAYVKTNEKSGDCPNRHICGSGCCH